MKRSRVILVLGLAVLFLTRCAGPQRRDGMPSDGHDAAKSIKIEPEARSLYIPAERNFLQKNYDVAVQGFQAVRQKFPRGRANMLASYRLGTIFYYRAQYPLASREFENFLARYPASELGFDVIYNLAASEYQQGNYDKAYQVLARLKPTEVQSQGPRRADVVYQLAAQTALAMNNLPGAIAAQAAELQLPLDESKRSELDGSINDELERVTVRGDLERLLGEVTEPSVKQKVSMRLAALVPATAAETAVTMGALPEVVGAEGPVGQGLQSSSSGERYNVGVVLPLTGKNAAYGKKALEAILLAAGTYQRNRESAFRVFVEDSASSPLMAQAAVDQLYQKYHVMAVIGPIGWKESLAVAERSQQLGVMNLSLTGKGGLSDRGAYLFQNALTPQVQLESLVRFCVGTRQFKRFAILAPDNSFGEDMSNEFWDLVERAGGHIVGFQTYAPEEKDFQSAIRSLTGLDDPRSRRFENGKLAEYIAQQKAKTGKEPKSRIPPVVDFDALFIPDSPKTVAQIAASLAYFDVTGATLLGTTEWNSDQLYKRGGRYVEGAMFPGGISLGSRNPRQKDFIRLYADAYGSAPDLLASQAFEAMELVATGLKLSGSSDRNSLVSELSNLKNYQTPLGVVTFDSARIAKRVIPVFTLETGGNIVEQ